MTDLHTAANLALDALELNNNEWKSLADSGDTGYWRAEDQDHYKQTNKAITALRQALANEALDKMAENARELGLDYEPAQCWKCGDMDAVGHAKCTVPVCGMREPEQPAQQEPVAWISVKDALPKAVRGVSYKRSLTDVVLVRHSDRPDYPITAHAVVGENLGAGVAIPTDGASEHPEIAWYSASSNLNNPFDLKNDNYDRYMPKIFGSKITHWMPLPDRPQAHDPEMTDWQERGMVAEAALAKLLDERQPLLREIAALSANALDDYKMIQKLMAERQPLTDEQINSLRQQHGITSDGRGIKEWTQVVDFARAIEAAYDIGEKK